MKKKYLWLMLAVVSSSSILWFFMRPVPVKTAVAEYGSAALFIYASGQVVPDEKVVIRSKNSARIAEIKVIEGQQIKAGEPLVLLEQGEMVAQYELAVAEQYQKEADYDFSLREITRYEQLLRSNAVAKRDYDQIKTQTEGARQQLIRAQANVAAFMAKKQEMSILSPFDGIVLEKTLDVGTAVGVSDGILIIAKLGKLQVEGKVDELDARKISVGQKVLLSFDSLKGQVHQGTIGTIAPRVDNATKSLKIKVALLENIPIQPGMSAELNILQLEKQQALLIPTTALMGDNVWIVEDGRARQRAIKSGIRDSQKIEVLEGLNRGDTVIINPQNLKDGTRVSL